MIAIFAKITSFLKIQEDSAELLDAHRHLAPQDAGGYRDSSLLKNVGAIASNTRVPSSRTHSSSWDFSLISQSRELKIKTIIKLTNNKAFRQQKALSPSFDLFYFGFITLLSLGDWCVESYFRRTEDSPSFLPENSY